MLYAFNKFNLGLYKPMLFGYITGYTSHLLLDFLTKAGIPIFYPFSRKRYHLLSIKSGGIAELMITITILGLLTVLAFIIFCNNDIF